MISGHRRLRAAKKAGLRKIPAIIKEMTDDEATIAMVDIHSGHIVNSGMTVIVRWGAIAVFVICKHSSSF